MNKLKEPLQLNIMVNSVNLANNGRVGVVVPVPLDSECVDEIAIEKLLIHLLNSLVYRLANESGFVSNIYKYLLRDEEAELNKCSLADQEVNGIEFGVRIMGAPAYHSESGEKESPVIRVDLIYTPDMPLTEELLKVEYINAK